MKNRLALPPSASAITAGFCILVFLANGPTAEASTLSASANIDWSTLRITPKDVGFGLPTFTWSNQATSSHASANCTDCVLSTDNTLVPDWTSGTTAIASIVPGPNGGPNAHADSKGSGSQLQSKLTASAPPKIPLFALTTNNLRSGSLTVLGKGTLLFQVDYSLAATQGSSNPADQLFGLTSVSIGLNGSTPSGGNVLSTSQTINRSLNNLSAPLSETGTLIIGAFFSDGWSGQFTAATAVRADAGIPLPVPAAVWLLASSAALISVLGRRKSNLA